MLPDRPCPFESTFGPTGTVHNDVSMTQRYDIRASDLDRERAVEFLKAHYAAGRLQHDELAARTDAAYRAVALSELDWLTSDLPALVRPRPRRRRISPLTAVLVCALLVALIVVVPPEAWLALIAIGALIAVVGFFLLAPVAVPALLLGGIVYLIVRATRPRPHQRRVGWR
jgi:Domain of unknown function (DUF1707)